MDELVDLGQKIADKAMNLTMSIKDAPWWPFINLECFVVPLLHALIGIGNDLLDQFRDWVNKDLEDWDQQEYRTRQAIKTADHAIIDDCAERDEWDTSADGKKLKSLKGMIRSRRNDMKRLDTLINIVADANVTSSISLNTKDMLTNFINHVATNNGIEEVDTDDVGDEAGNVVVVIQDLLNENVKRKIEKYRDEVTDK